MDKTFSFKDVVKILNDKNLKYYHVHLDSENITKGIWFIDFDSFIEFLNEKEIESVFINEEFYDCENFIISDEIIEKEIKFGVGIPEKILKDIMDKLKNIE